jgi:hypothetical protein
MKTLRFALLALLLPLGIAAIATAASGTAQAQVSADIHIGPGGPSVDLGYFYDDLASYGNWIERPSYGWVWTPRSVASSWQPYQDGHWVSTDQGWTWVTSEPYGWATYHYGRWYDDPEIGWSWVPGNEWAPSWVSFQEGADYIGWAPLPPSVDIAVGFNGLVNVSIAPEYYVFVQERNFLAPSLGSYYIPRDRRVNIYHETRNISNYRYSDNRVYNQGVSVDRIQQVVGRPVPRYKLADLKTRGAARVQGNQVEVFRPQVQRTANVQPPSARPVARKAVVNAAQFQQSHPDRAAARRAQAQGAAVQPNPQAKAAPQPKPARPAKVNPAQPDRSGQTPPTAQTRPRARNQATQPTEATPPTRQPRTNQPTTTPAPQNRPAVQPKRQRQPETQTPPPASRERQTRVQQQQQERQQRQPQNNPPPQQRQQQPQEKRQPQSPPPQNQQRQQRQQERQQEKEKPQQDDHKPPQA